MILKRDQILAADDLKRELVSVPEWGGEVYVSMMTGAARDAFEASILGADRKPVLADMRAKLAVACITDENGARLFDASDVPALSAKSGAALERVAQVAQRLNRMSDSDLEDAAGN